MDTIKRKMATLTLKPVQLQAMGFALIFAVVGGVLLVTSRASTPAAGVEAENGSASSNASVLSDSSASGGSAIRFGSGQTLNATMTSTLEANTKYQTMDGFGVSINSGSWDNGGLKPALDMLIDQNGSKIYRVVMEMTDWESTNDNSDPNSYNWSYYNPIYSGATSFDTSQHGANFANLWNTIDYLHQKGIPDKDIILSFMGIGPSWNGGTTVNTTAQENEWVEQVVSAAYYGYSNDH